jgi:serine/threonine-protein kinase
MVLIPGGTFTMGRDDPSDPEETPAHQVSVSTFSIDRVPVTNAQFAAFVRGTGNAPPPKWPGGKIPQGQEKWPVTEVTWEEAQAYCEWKVKRLPAEAEWEYAARGTDGRLYPWGNDFTASHTNSLESGLGEPEPVGTRLGNASPFGVLDMSGNVWQWCAVDYKPYLRRKPSFEIPAGAKVIRGGSFQSDRDHVTTTTRNLELPTKRSPVIGFRCAKSK